MKKWIYSHLLSMGQSRMFWGVGIGYWTVSLITNMYFKRPIMIVFASGLLLLCMYKWERLK